MAAPSPFAPPVTIATLPLSGGSAKGRYCCAPWTSIGTPPRLARLLDPRRVRLRAPVNRRESRSGSARGAVLSQGENRACRRAFASRKAGRRRRAAGMLAGEMKAAPFSYCRPASVPDAVAALAAEGAMPLAGGQSLLGLMAMRRAAPRLLVDLDGLAGAARAGDGRRRAAADRGPRAAGRPARPSARARARRPAGRRRAAGRHAAGAQRGARSGSAGARRSAGGAAGRARRAPRRRARARPRRRARERRRRLARPPASSSPRSRSSAWRPAPAGRSRRSARGSRRARSSPPSPSPPAARRSWWSPGSPPGRRYVVAAGDPVDALGGRIAALVPVADARASLAYRTDLATTLAGRALERAGAGPRRRPAALGAVIAPPTAATRRRAHDRGRRRRRMSTASVSSGERPPRRCSRAAPRGARADRYASRLRARRLRRVQRAARRRGGRDPACTLAARPTAAGHDGRRAPRRRRLGALLRAFASATRSSAASARRGCWWRCGPAGGW